jgi:HlyD family secretion protein
VDFMLTPGRKIAVLVAVLLVAGAAAFLIAAPFRAEDASPAAPSGASVQKRWTAVAPGRVEPLSRDIKIAAAVIGRIAEVLVKPNDRVFAGELLVRLDDGEALARLAAAEAQAALRKRVRNDGSTPKGSAERRKAEDAVADAERFLTEARAGLDRTAAARRAGRTSQAGLDSARITLSLAQDRLREQQDALRRIKIAPGTALPSRLEGELNVSRAELTLAEAELEKTRIRSPLAGTVLQVQAKPGELATPSSEQPLVLLGDVSALRVRAELDERDLVKIRVGQRVAVRADAFRDREFEGKVASIEQVVGPSRMSARGPRKFSDIDVMEVLVDLADPGPLVPGMQADVYFSSDTAGRQGSR